jgi:hypothetical protein
MAKHGVNSKMNALTAIMFLVIFSCFGSHIRSLAESRERKKKLKGVNRT